MLITNQKITMEHKSTFWKSAMIYGLYLGIVITLYSVILYVAGQNANKSLGYIINFTAPLIKDGIKRMVL